jgi:hypothetical protein
MTDEQVIDHIFKLGSSRLPDDPEISDLLPFLGGRMKSKRLRKKFLNNHQRYWMLLPRSVYDEFLGKILGRPLANEVFRVLSDEGWTRKLLVVTPVEEGTNDN